MSSDVPKITLIEDYRDKNGDGAVWNYRADFFNTVGPAQAEFTFKLSKVLTEFRNQWIAEHADDHFAKGLEVDYLPVFMDGMLMGFMVISEIDGKSYEYAPAENVEKEGDEK